MIDKLCRIGSLGKRCCGSCFDVAICMIQRQQQAIAIGSVEITRTKRTRVMSFFLSQGTITMREDVIPEAGRMNFTMVVTESATMLYFVLLSSTVFVDKHIEISLTGGSECYNKIFA